VHVEAMPGVVTVLAAWMLDPVACAGMEIQAPRVAPSALTDLHHLLITLGFRRDSRNESNIVRENDNAVSETGAISGRIPMEHGARLGDASGNESRPEARGGCVAGQAAHGGSGRRGRGGQR